MLAISEFEWSQILNKYGHKCLRCKSHGPLEKDHVVPLSKGGEDIVENVQPLCMTCNRLKANKYIDYRGKLKYTGCNEVFNSHWKPVKEAVKLLNLSEGTIRKQARKGNIPSARSDEGVLLVWCKAESSTLKKELVRLSSLIDRLESYEGFLKEAISQE